MGKIAGLFRPVNNMSYTSLSKKSTTDDIIQVPSVEFHEEFNGMELLKWAWKNAPKKCNIQPNKAGYAALSRS